MPGEKVIFDTDFNVIGDDGQAFVMLAHLQAEGAVSLLGMTVVSGNQWVEQGVADALRAVERMGLVGLPVLAGADRPLLLDAQMAEAARRHHGAGYVGAWASPRMRSAADLVAPPDGFARAAAPVAGHAADFIIESIKAHPGEVTLLAVGPLTNIALAFAKAPEIVPLVRNLVVMGGALGVPGNTTAAAEFNLWFDPEAARIVLRKPVPRLLIPLDVTDTVPFDKALYERITSGRSTAVTRLFEHAWAERFARDPSAGMPVWDAVAVAAMAAPEIVTARQRLFVDVETAFGPDYGRSVGHAAEGNGYDATARMPGLRPADVVLGIDRHRFREMFADMMTRPVPVAAAMVPA